jgi:hypothetical protein
MKFVDRIGMDIVMGFGSIMVGVGTLMAIGGTDPQVFRASKSHVWIYWKYEGMRHWHSTVLLMGHGLAMYGGEPIDTTLLLSRN